MPTVVLSPSLSRTPYKQISKVARNGQAIRYTNHTPFVIAINQFFITSVITPYYTHRVKVSTAGENDRVYKLGYCVQ